jgi:hypothetical protein
MMTKGENIKKRQYEIRTDDKRDEEEKEEKK